MLLGVDRPVPLTERIRGQRWVALVLGLALTVEVALAVRLGIGFSHGRLPDFTRVNRGGNVQALASVLFNSYFFPFEVTSILLIVAAIGAMLHGRRRIVDEAMIDAPGPEEETADTPVEEPVA
jgi:NADH-quinone oxidoreductase subunit J